MSRVKFGQRLGVSCDTIANIELNRLARPDQKMSLYKLICSEFGVAEDWLLHGIEPIFMQPETFSLDDFVKKYDGTDFEIEIVKSYFELSKETRKEMVSSFKKLLSRLPDDTPKPVIPDTPEEFEKLYPPISEDNKKTDAG